MNNISNRKLTPTFVTVVKASAKKKKVLRFKTKTIDNSFSNFSNTCASSNFFRQPHLNEEPYGD